MSDGSNSNSFSVDEIKIDWEIHCRDEVDDTYVKQYQKVAPEIRPVVLSEDLRIVDGIHRFKAFETVGFDQIPAQILELESDFEYYKKSIELNNNKIGLDEKREIVGEIQSEVTAEEISEIVGVGKWAIAKWITQDNPKTPEKNHLKKIVSSFPEKVSKLWNEPRTVSRYFQRWKHARIINKKYYEMLNSSKFNDSGRNIFNYDWDNMIVLDACRSDIFINKWERAESVEEVQSKASMTHEWIEANFTDRVINDLVYIDANGNYYNLKEDIDSEVYEYIPLWEDKYREGPHNLVTPPNTVTKKTLEAADSFPNKRLLIHYLQPHHPYIGSTGKQLNHGAGISATIGKNHLSDRTLHRAYEENVEIVLDEIEPLLNNLQGKTVITADHGEMLGDRGFPIPIKMYGHPRGVYINSLVNIPWVELESGYRKNIESGDMNKTNKDDFDLDIEQHLENLGYM